jgi:hypothetical protein
MGIDFKIVIEPSESVDYLKNFESKYLHIAPENFSARGMGSIPVRNYVLNLSKKNGEKKHWILDDNIEGFNRLNRNTKFVVKNDSIFRACEDFTDRFKNIALSGMNYYCFAKSTDNVPQFQINTRIYSCILFNNDIPFEWRGRYNEDTDLSLRCLKAGWNTILFNAFLCGKITSMRNKGGNENIYKESNNRLDFAKSLEQQHPDLVKTVWRFNRWHHQVNYKPFKNRSLEYIDGYIKPENKINEYGMKLVIKRSNNE